MRSTPVYVQILLRYTSVYDRITMTLITHLVYQHREVKEYNLDEQTFLKKQNHKVRILFSSTTERPLTTFKKRKEKCALNLP